MPTAPLPNVPGLEVSRVIKGCWQLSGAHKGDPATDRTSGKAAVEDFDAFVNAGVTTFDAADHYGPAELLIGRYLAQGQPGLRDRLQIMTKVCVFDSVGMATVSRASMDLAVATCAARLGTRPDNVQFYWGSYDIPRYVDAAKYLAEGQAAGNFRALGVTNFDVKRMAQMTDAGVTLASNQLQYSLLDRRPENGMAQFCLDRGIALLPYGVLAGGLLSEKYLGAPPSSVKLDTVSKRKYAPVIGEAGGFEWYQRLLRALDGIAKKHDTTISNVAAKWVLDRPGVAGVILGARNASHAADAPVLANLQLDEADKAAISEVLAAGKKPKGDCYQWERGLGPF